MLHGNNRLKSYISAIAATFVAFIIPKYLGVRQLPHKETVNLPVKLPGCFADF